MTFVSFSDWFTAMGDALIRFRIKERIKDKVKGADLFYKNIITEDDFYLLGPLNFLFL